MPAARVVQATIIYRVWKPDGELTEDEKSFTSLDELFALCLHAGDPPLVDRITLRGIDEDGDTRTLTLAFRSLTRVE